MRTTARSLVDSTTSMPSVERIVSFCQVPVSVIAASVGIARQFAVEHPHHRREVKPLALGARVAVISARGLNLRHDLVGKDLERPPRAHRQHLSAADALELVEAAIGLRDRLADDEDAVVL